MKYGDLEKMYGEVDWSDPVSVEKYERKAKAYREQADGKSIGCEGAGSESAGSERKDEVALENVVAYCRVSTDGQTGEDKFGIESQKEIVLKRTA